jgi:superfamily II DNA or RNA helicase
MEFESEAEREALERATSFSIPGSQFSASYTAGCWDGKKRFLTAANKLPMGLFKSLFPTHSLVYNTNPDYSFNDLSFFRMNPQFAGRKYQLEAINTIFTEKRLIIAAVVGAGKTLIAAATILKHLETFPKGKVLFVVYDKNILKQTADKFTEYGIPYTVFGGGTKDLTGDVVIATIQTLNNLKNPTKSLAAFTMCFSDEAHHSKAKTSKDIFSRLKGCEYYIGLTGTPPKQGTLDYAELVCTLGPVRYEYGFQTATTAGNIAPVKCFFLRTPFSFDTAGKTVNRKNYQTIWENGIRDSEIRNKTIASVVATINTLLKTPTLIMVDRTEHGCNIGEQIKQFQNIRHLEMYGEDSIVVREAKREFLMNNDIDILISTLNKEGVDFAISPVVAFNAAGRKSFVSQIQFLGRIVRKNEDFKSFRVYYDFLDIAHPKLKEHSEERLQACRDTGSSVVICESINELLAKTIEYYKECGLKAPTF